MTTIGIMLGGKKKMKKILPLIIIGILVLSGLGTVAVSSNVALIDNHPPDPPQITGPWQVRPGTHEWTFKAIDPDGDNVSYEILWGDGTSDKWIGPYPSGEEVTQSHTYYSYATVTIKARANDTHGAIGDWGYMTVEISKSTQQSITGSSISQNTVNVISSTDTTMVDNHPPGKPTIDGPGEGIVGITYVFDFSAEDPDGDNVSYYVEWGDGDVTDWTSPQTSGTPYSESHTWYKIDHFSIRCKAKDIYGAEGNWTDLIIFVSRNKAFNFNFNLLEWLLEQTSQQSSCMPGSQSVISNIPSNGNIAEASSYKPNNPPYEPSNPHPPDDGTNVPIDVTLCWTGGDPNPDDMVTYEIYFGDEPNPPFITQIGPYPADLTEISYQIYPLTNNTTYYWQIIVIDNHDASTPGPCWTFTTGINHPPSAPIIEGPDVKSVPIPLPKPGIHNFTFKATDPDGHDVYYYIDWGDGTVEGWIGPYLSGEKITRSHGYSEQGDFTVKAKAKDIYGLEGPWGTLRIPIKISQSNQQSTTGSSSQSVMSVIPSNGNIGKASSICKSNNPPYVPSNPFPDDGATNVPVNITLCWEGGDPDPGDSVTYDVYFGTTIPPPQRTSNQTYTFYKPPYNLTLFMTYYWRIVAWDSQGLSTSGPCWTFTTGINHPPSAPIIDGPTHGKVGVEYEYTFNSTDGDGHDFCYCVDWGDDSPIEIVCPSNPDGSGVAKANHSWDTEGTYIIRARAKDIYGAVGPWGYLEVTMPKNKPAIQNSQQSSTNQNIQSGQLLQQMVKTTRTTNR